MGVGYSWKTNQYGLTIDNIVSHEVVLPGGEVVRSSNETNSDLFFGLKVNYYFSTPKHKFHNNNRVD